MIWSNALTYTALEYLNDYGPDLIVDQVAVKYSGLSSGGAFVCIGSNKYFGGVCGSIFQIYHSINTEATWNANATGHVQNFIADGMFDNASLLSGDYTHMGIACGCQNNATNPAQCMAIFSNSFNAFQVTQ